MISTEKANHSTTEVISWRCIYCTARNFTSIQSFIKSNLGKMDTLEIEMDNDKFLCGRCRQDKQPYEINT